MKKRELKNGKGFVQYDDPRELKKLFLLDDETVVLGLCNDNMADVYYFSPAFREIAGKIEECYATDADSQSGTYRLDNNYAINLKVLPTAEAGDKSLSMTLVCGSKDVYTLVQNIGNKEAYKNAHEFMLDFMTQWILNLSMDITHQSLFWLYDQDYETVHDMLSQV